MQPDHRPGSTNVATKLRRNFPTIFVAEREISAAARRKSVGMQRLERPLQAKNGTSSVQIEVRIRKRAAAMVARVGAKDERWVWDVVGVGGGGGCKGTSNKFPRGKISARPAFVATGKFNFQINSFGRDLRVFFLLPLPLNPFR